MQTYRQLHRRAPTAARLVRGMGTLGWRLLVQPAEGARQWRGFLIDERTAERNRLAPRTLDLLVAEGYISRTATGVIWTARGHGWNYLHPRPVFTCDEYTVTAEGRAEIEKS